MKLIPAIANIGLLSLGLLSCSGASAEPNRFDDYKYEITPFGGFRLGGGFSDTIDNPDPTSPDATINSHRDLSSSASYGLLLHLIQSPGAYYEFSYSKQRTELEGNSPFDLSIEYFQVGGTLEFAEPEDRVRPYLALTVGATRFVPDQQDLNEETAASMSIGFGAKIPVTKHVAVRLEARAYISFLNADSDVFCIGAGGSAACSIHVQSSYFIQGQGLLGVTFGF